MEKKILASSLIAAFVLAIVLVIGFFATRTESPSTSAQNNVKSAISEDVKKETVKLEIFSKGVSVQTPNNQEFSDVQNNQEIGVGTKVKTDKTGRAQLVYPNGSVTRVDFNSEITLSLYDSSPFKTNIKLAVGKIWSRVAKLLGNESYETQTQNTVATIRGTSYGHETSASGDEILTTKGAVDGSCINENEHDLVEKDMKAFYDCKNSSDPKVGKITNQDKDGWFNFNNEEDKKLNEKFGEDTYKDGDVLGLETSAPTPTPKLSFAPPAAPLIDCVGADGKVTKQTKETCDAVAKFWKDHPPAPEDPAGDMPQSSTPAPTPTETPTPTPVPTPQITSVEEVCTDIDQCFFVDEQENFITRISVKIHGQELDNPTSVFAMPVGEFEVEPSPIPATGFTETVPLSEIDVHFDQVLGVGDYTINLTLNNGTNLTGPEPSFTVTADVRGEQVIEVVQ